MTDVDELVHRFRFHPAVDPDVHAAHADIREGCLILAQGLTELIPDGRELALALTNLEQAMFWANAGIARRGLRPAPHSTPCDAEDCAICRPAAVG